MAQHFNCSSTTGGLGSCSYDTVIDAQCHFGPRVAGVRCTESKNFPYHMLYSTVYNFRG